MSTTLILPDLMALGRAAADLGRAAGDNRALVNAVNKAHFHLIKGSCEIVHSGFDGFLITSASRAGVVHRVSAVNGCSCEAGQSGKPCWHQQAIALLDQAGIYSRPTLETAPLGRPVAERIAAERYARAKAQMDELYA